MPTATERTGFADPTDLTHSEVRNVASYRTAILAVYKNTLVRLIATGDIPGRSPVCQYVDNEGKIGWDSMVHFTIVDGNFLPPNPDRFRNLMNLLK